MKFKAGQTFTRVAAIDKGAVNEKERTAVLSFSSETGVERWGEMEYLSHDAGAVDMTRLQEMGVLLFNHDASAVIGAVRSVSLDEAEHKGRAVVQFDADEDSEKVWQKVVSGTLRGVSVGYMVDNWEEVRAGSVSSNGRFTGPCYVASRWQPLEISIVAVPADPSVGVGRSLNVDEGSDVEMDTEKMKGQAAAQQAAQQAAPAEVREAGQTAAEQGTAAASPSVDEAAVRAAETSRCSEIRAMERQFALDLGSYITNGSSVDAVRAAVLEQLAAREHPVNVQVGQEEPLKFRSAARDALLLRGGRTVQAPAAGAEELRSFRLERVAEECLTRSGAHAPSDRREMIGRALTTTDFPVILGDVARLSLQEGWNEEPESYLAWVDDSGVVSDFKTYTTARVGEGDDLLPVPESGEYKYSKRSEESEQYKIGTFGRMFAISRQAIINDELGALTDTPREFGAAAQRLVGDVAYAPLVENSVMGDGTALFAKDHGNLQTAAAFSFDAFEATISAVSTMELAMAAQKGPDKKKRLNIQPQFLIVPVALKLAAKRFLAQLTTPLSVDTAANKASGSAANPYASAFTLVCDARLDDASSTAYYLAAAKRKTVRLYFLDGVKTPYLEQRDGWNVDGTEFKVRIDVGSKALDWRGLQKNPGK